MNPSLFGDKDRGSLQTLGSVIVDPTFGHRTDVADEVPSVPEILEALFGKKPCSGANLVVARYRKMTSCVRRGRGHVKYGRATQKRP